MLKAIFIKLLKSFCIFISILLLLFSLLFVWIAIKPINLNFAMDWADNKFNIPNELTYSDFELAWGQNSWGPELRLNNAKWQEANSSIYLGDVAISSNFKKALSFQSILEDISIKNLTITIVKEDGKVFLRAFSRRSNGNRQEISTPNINYNQLYNILGRIGGISVQDIQIQFQDNDSEQIYVFPYISVSLRAKDDEFQLLGYLHDNEMILKKGAQIFAGINKQTLALHGRMLIEDFDFVDFSEYGPLPKMLVPYWPTGSAPATFFATFEGSIEDFKNIQLTSHWNLRTNEVELIFPDWPNNPTFAKEILIDGDFNFKTMILGIKAIEIQADPEKPMYFPNAKAAYRVKEGQASGYLNLKNRYLDLTNISIDTGRYKAEGAYKTQIGWPITKNAFSAQLPEIHITDIMDMWPQNAGEPAWQWIKQNVKDGYAKGLLAMRIDHDADNMWKTDFSSFLSLKDIILNYTAKTPDIMVQNASVKMQGENIIIDNIDAKTDDLVINDAQVMVGDIQQGKSPWLTTNININHTVSSILKYLQYFNENMLKNTNIKLSQITGQIIGNFSLKLNFDNTVDYNNLNIADLNLNGEGVISKASIKDIFDGKNITSDNLKYIINGEIIQFSGPFTFQDQQVNIDDLSINIAGKEPLWSFKATANIPISWLKSYSPDAKKALEAIYAKGSLVATITANSSNPNKIDVSINLNNTDFNIEAISFKKPAGTAGKLNLEIHLNGNNIDIPKIYLNAKDLTLTAKTSINNGKLETIDVESFTQKETNLTAKYYTGSSQNTADVKGILDLRRENFTADLTDKKINKNSKPTRVNINLSKIYMNAAEFNDAKGWLVFQGNTAIQAEITAKAGNSAPIKITITPRGNLRDVRVVSNDGGSVIRGFGINQSIYNGILEISGIIDDSKASQPFEGVATLTNFTVKDAPALTHLLGFLSLSQLSNSLSGNGLVFEKANIPFKMENKMLSINDAEVAGNALAGTIDGTVGLDDNGLLNLSGVIVPFNSFSNTTGKIPVLGTLLTGVQGKGIFAADYKIRGTKQNMQITSNPLKALAPGVLRNIFDVIGGVAQ